MPTAAAWNAARGSHRRRYESVSVTGKHLPQAAKPKNWEFLLMIVSRQTFRRASSATLAIAVIASLLTARSATAQTNYYWNGSSGTWNDSSLVWNSPNSNSPLTFWSDGSDNNVAIFNGSTAGTVTLGATVDPGTIDFNTTGYTIAPPSPNPNGYSINLGGSAPEINVGNGSAAFTATISANVTSTSGSAALVLENTSTGSAAINTQLNLGGSLTMDSGSLRIVGNSNKSATFTLNTPSMSLTNMTFTSLAANTTILGTSTSPTITFTGANPTINTGESANSSYKDISQIASTVVVSPSAGPLVFMNNDGLGTQSALSFGINGVAVNNSFPNGIMVESAASLSFNSTSSTATGTTRLNFNAPGANGSNVSGGAGPIYVVANGAIITNQGSQPSFTLQMPNNLYLNYDNITPAQGIFVTAIGCTKPNSGTVTEIDYSGQISGNGSILIGNDVAPGSGGAGVTEFSGAQKTYTGETIINTSQNGIFKMGATDVLPSGTTVVFGYSNTITTGNQIGAMDLNGFSQTIASLQSNIDATAGSNGNVINGITNTSSTMATLTITGSSVDTYVGGIGTSAQPLNLGTSNNNEALTRTGSGTTILSNSANPTPVTYIGDTNVDGTSTLEAGFTSGFSPNSNFIVEANLNLNGWNNTINSLSSVGSAGIVTTSQANQVTGLATILTIGSNTTLNAETAPTTTFNGSLQDGGPGMQLGLTMGGKGNQILAGTNTYTGPTTVNNGTLTIASTGSLANTAVTVNAGTFNGSGSVGGSVMVNATGTLAGTLNIGGSVSVEPSAFIAPGTSTVAGTLTTGALTLYGGSTYDWKLTSSGNDLLSSSGLTIDSSATTTPISLDISILNPNFSSTQQSWTIASSASPINLPAGTVSSFFSPFTSASVFGSFAVSESGNTSLVLTFTPANVTRLTWQGGTGNWNASGTGGDMSWNNGSSFGPWTDGDVAVFPSSSTGGLVTLKANVSTPLLEFDTTGYTVAAGTGPYTITDWPSSGFNFISAQVTNASDTATIGAGIVSPLSKTGAGTLVLTGGSANTFGNVSGNGINVYGGTLRGGNTSLNTNINNNGVVAFDQSGISNGNYSGSISGGGSVVVTNSTPGTPETFTLSGNNTYTGGTTINSGATLEITDPTNIGGSSAGITFNGGTLATPSNTQLTFGGQLSVTVNGGGITDNGSSSTNSFSGGGNLVSGAVFTKNGPGTLQILDSGFTGSGTIVINQGMLLVGDPTNLTSNPSTYLGGNTLTLNDGTTLMIAAGTPAAASITPPNLNINGNVTINLDNTGGVQGQGPLEAALNSVTTVTATSAGSTITFTGGGDLAGSSTVTVGNTTFAATTGTITIQTVAGAGANGFSTGVTFGAVTDNGDTLQFLGQGNNALMQSPGPGVSFNGTGSTRGLTGAWIIGDPGDTNGQIVTAAVQSSPNPQFALTTGNITINPGSQLSLTSLAVIGANAFGPSSGTQTITIYGSGPNDSTGSATGALTVAAKAQEEFNSNVSFVLGNSVIVGGMPTSTGSVEFDLSNGSSTQKTIMTIDGSVTGAAGFDLQGGDLAELIFAGPNNLTGHTTLKGGTLIVDANSSIGTGNLNMNQTTTHNPTLVLNEPTQSVANLSSSYGGGSSTVTQTIQLNGTALTINETDTTGNADYGISPNDGSFSAGSTSFITGSGSIIFSGATGAYLSLSGQNDYMGGTTVTGGTLATTLGGVLGSGSLGFTAASGAAPALSLGASQNVSSLSNSTTGTGASTLAVASGSTLTVGGNLTNNGLITLGSVTAPGATSAVGGGTVVVSGNANLGASSQFIVATGLLQFTSSSGSSTISGSGGNAPSITVSPGATLQLAGSVSSLSGGGNAANVNNNSSATGPGVGGLQVTGTNQTVGIISGTSSTSNGATVYSGDTVVGDSADVSAAQILQNSLTVGDSATAVILPASTTMVMAAQPAESSSASASASVAGANASAGSADPLAVIQSAVDSGAISSAKGQVLDDRIATIESEAAINPDIDVAALEGHVLDLISPNPTFAPTTFADGTSTSTIDASLALGGAGSESDSLTLGSSTAFALSSGSSISVGSGVSAVPEPSTWILAIFGICGLVALRTMGRRVCGE